MSDTIENDNGPQPFPQEYVDRFSNFRNLQWVNAEHTWCDALVDIEGAGDDMPYTFAEYEFPQLLQEFRDGDFGEIAEYVPPPPEPDPIIVIPMNILLARMTDDEYGELDDTIKLEESARTYRMWSGAQEITEDSDMWNMAKGHMVTLFGEPRANELLEAV